MLVTVIEVLSPVSKVSKDGRQQYLEKRAELLGKRISLVEIDLLRPVSRCQWRAPSCVATIVSRRGARLVQSWSMLQSMHPA